MDKAYKILAEKSFNIKRIKHGFSFQSVDDAICKLTIEPNLEIYKGEALLTANYNLSISGYQYSYGSSKSSFGEKELQNFAKMHQIIENKYDEETENKEKHMYNFVRKLRE